jgi:cytochrome c biogenesis protein CcmG, thiol:disulfide interchange protein DsbE
MAVKTVKAALVLVTLALIVYIYVPAQYSGKVRPNGSRTGLGDFTLQDLEGKDWQLAAHRGQVVLVNFWATWCAPCRDETPGLVRVANDYAGKVAVVGIASDDPVDAVTKFVAEYKIPYPVLVPSGRFALASAVESLPTTFLIDRQGKVAKTYIGRVRESVFRADIDRLLAETGA